MKVILTDDVKSIGKKGEVVNVKTGYFRNFLIPAGKAIEATKENMAELKKLQDKMKAEEAENRKKAEAIKEKIEGLTLTKKVRTGEDGKLFGSVTNKDIAQALKEEGIDLDRKKIEGVEKIIGLGEFVLNAKLFEGVNANLKVNVVSEAE